MSTLLGKTVMKLLPSKSLRRALVKSASNKLRWKLALPCEEKYWHDYISQSGGQYAADFAQRLDPNLPLQPHIRDHIAFRGTSTVRILDVGAGPLTCLGKTWPGRTLELTPTDPLANDYARILRAHNVTPPVPTQFCCAERLTSKFPENHFDLAYSRNALDHSFEPLAAISQMLKVIKPDCTILLEHLLNEAETEKYYGLHQWNFTQRDNQFIIWNKRTTLNVAAELGPQAQITSTVANNWLTVTIKKIP